MYSLTSFYGMKIVNLNFSSAIWSLDLPRIAPVKRLFSLNHSASNDKKI